MKQKTIQIPYTEDLLLSLKQTGEQFEKDARFLLALKLYELQRISSGKAARLADMDRIIFLSSIGKYNVSPFQVGMEEIVQEAGE